MDIEQIIDSMTPEVYQRLATAVELGKWPDGVALTPEQKENSLQLVMLWQARYNTDAQHMTIDTSGQMVMKSKQQLKRILASCRSRSPPLNCNKPPAGGETFRRRVTARRMASCRMTASGGQPLRLLFVHHRFQIGKRVVGGLADALCASSPATTVEPY